MIWGILWVFYPRLCLNLRYFDNSIDCLPIIAAQQAQITNIKNTIYNLKRFVGRAFNDPRVQFEKQHFSPFNVIEGPSNTILIQANYMGELSTFTPEQITAMLFTKLKDAGERY